MAVESRDLVRSGSLLAVVSRREKPSSRQRGDYDCGSEAKVKIHEHMEAPRRETTRTKTQVCFVGKLAFGPCFMKSDRNTRSSCVRSLRLSLARDDGRSTRCLRRKKTASPSGALEVRSAQTYPCSRALRTARVRSRTPIFERIFET